MMVKAQSKRKLNNLGFLYKILKSFPKTSSTKCLVTKMNTKVYVAVKANFREDGVLIPFELTWEDGHQYIIDRVVDIRQAAAMRAGGQGGRYTVVINGQRSYLFFERSTNLTGNILGRWFVERKTA